MRQKIKLRNPFARVLASRLYRRRMIKAKKGKGSYKRRPKHSLGRRFLFELLMPERMSAQGHKRTFAGQPKIWFFYFFRAGVPGPFSGQSRLPNNAQAAMAKTPQTPKAGGGPLN